MTGAVLVALATVGAFAQTTSVTRTVSWETGDLVVQLAREVPATGANRPAAVARVQAEIIEESVSLIVEVLQDLPYDSYYDIGSYLEENEHQIGRVLDAARRAEPIQSRSSNDLRIAEVTFRLDLHEDLISQLVEHDEPAAIPRSLGWWPGGEYTGVLIYAAEPLEHIDTGRRVNLNPTLFPGIYFAEEGEEQLYRLIEAENVTPESLSRWGVFGYTTDPFATELLYRIGANPLQIMATGVFGANATDPVIRRSDALQLLSSDHNRQLLQEGRVVVIIPPTE